MRPFAVLWTARTDGISVTTPSPLGISAGRTCCFQNAIAPCFGPYCMLVELATNTRSISKPVQRSSRFKQEPRLWLVVRGTYHSCSGMTCHLRLWTTTHWRKLGRQEAGYIHSSHRQISSEAQENGIANFAVDFDTGFHGLSVQLLTHFRG